MGGFRERWRGWMKRWWFRRGLEVGYVLIALAAVGLCQSRDLLSTGKRAPGFTRPLLNGTRQSLSGLRGKPVVLSFWAPWCRICRAETGALSALHRAHPEVAVLSVALDYRNLAAVRAFVAAEGVDYPVLLGDASLGRSFHVEAFPTTYFIDPHGRIDHVTVGYTTGLGLRARLWF